MPYTDERKLAVGPERIQHLSLTSQDRAKHQIVQTKNLYLPASVRTKSALFDPTLTGPSIFLSKWLLSKSSILDLCNRIPKIIQNGTLPTNNIDLRNHSWQNLNGDTILVS